MARGISDEKNGATHIQSLDYPKRGLRIGIDTRDGKLFVGRIDLLAAPEVVR